MRRALDPDPARRYADAGEMRKELAREARGAERFVPERNESERIRWAAALLALIATVGLQGLHGVLQVGPHPVLPGGSLAVALGALLAAAPILRAVHRRWRQDKPGTAPPDYVPLDAGRVAPAATLALLAFLGWYAVDRSASPLAPLARAAADLLGVVALYRAWVVLLDARRVKLGLGRYGGHLAFGLAPSLVPMLLGWIG